MKKACCFGRRQQAADHSAAERVADEHHPLRIAVECPDAVLNPAQRLDRVKYAVVAGGTTGVFGDQFFKREVAQYAETPVYANEDRTGGTRNGGSINARHGASGAIAAAAVQVNDNGPRGQVTVRPDIGKQTVFGSRYAVAPGLDAGRPKTVGYIGLFDGERRARRSKPVLGYERRGVAYTPEHPQFALDTAAYPSLCYKYFILRGLRGWLATAAGRSAARRNQSGAKKYSAVS